MKYYAAPMEGITGYIYRNAHHHYYPGIYKYFTPFLTPKMKKGMNSKEKNDILPAHNVGIHVVPQILTNQAGDFLHMVDVLAELGYDEMNLNLGCPSGTVVSKGKGCGFLKDRDKLRQFFEDVMSGLDASPAKSSGMKISVKTRLGIDDPEEIIHLMEIYNDYPLSEVIIHARIHKDFYKRPVNWQAFGEALAMSRHPVCYNGDLLLPEDLVRFQKTFPQVERVMLGRGLIADPELELKMEKIEQKIEKIEEGAEKIEQKSDAIVNTSKFGVKVAQPDFDYDRFFRFHEEILEGYIEIMSGERNVLFKMKELWSYMGVRFMGQEKVLKKIRKSNNLMEYNQAVRTLSNGI